MTRHATLLKRALLAFVLLNLLACEVGQNKFSIDKLFGFRFGDVPESAPNEYLADDQTLEALNPSREEPFTAYQLMVTPGGHKIHSIMAQSESIFSRQTCNEAMNRYADKLLARFSDVEEIIISTNEDTWAMQEKGARTLSLSCTKTTGLGVLMSGNYQLSLVSQDKALAVEAYKEWQKRQKSSDKFR